MPTVWEPVRRLRLVAALMVGVLANPGAAETPDPRARLEGLWEGRGVQAGTDGWTIRIALPQAGGGKIDYPSLDCGGTLTLLGSRGDTVAFREEIDYGRDRCTPQGEVRLTPQSDDELLFEYRRQGERQTSSSGTVRKATAALSAAAPAKSAATIKAEVAAMAKGWRDFIPEGSRFKGPVRSEPKYVGGPRRNYDVDIDFVGDMPVVRLGIGQTENGFTCLGALQFLRRVSPTVAEFGFGKMGGRGDMIIDCPDRTEVRLEKVAGGLAYSWTAPGREPVSGVLADKTAEIAAERQARAEAERNAKPCTHVTWTGPQTNIADTLMCDEGKAISLFRKGAQLNLGITDVSFGDGRLIGSAKVASLTGKGSVEVVCVFAADSDMELSTGDAITVEARLTSYAGGRLVFDCAP